MLHPHDHICTGWQGLRRAVRSLSRLRVRGPRCGRIAHGTRYPLAGDAVPPRSAQGDNQLVPVEGWSRALLLSYSREQRGEKLLYPPCGHAAGIAPMFPENNICRALLKASPCPSPHPRAVSASIQDSTLATRSCQRSSACWILRRCRSRSSITSTARTTMRSNDAGKLPNSTAAC